METLKTYEAEDYTIECYRDEEDIERIKFISKQNTGFVTDVLVSDMIALIADSFKNETIGILDYNSKNTKMIKVERTVNFELPLTAQDGTVIDHINFFQDLPLEIAMAEQAAGLCKVDREYFEIDTGIIMEQVFPPIQDEQ
jgi:hypothetical protein